MPPYRRCILCIRGAIFFERFKRNATGGQAACLSRADLTDAHLQNTSARPAARRFFGDLLGFSGAGSGNRTRTLSLEGSYDTISPYPLGNGVGKTCLKGRQAQDHALSIVRALLSRRAVAFGCCHVVFPPSSGDWFCHIGATPIQIASLARCRRIIENKASFISLRA